MGTIYHNGNILTMVAEGDSPSAILTGGGRILAIGTLEKLRRHPGAEHADEVDLRGKTLLPAFIDSHSHLMQLALNMDRVDLTEAKSFADIQMRLEQFIKTRPVPKGQYIQGFGYDHTRLAKQAHPTKSFLDEICPQNPVYLSHISMHMGVANSLALARAGIADNESGFVEEMGMYGIYMDLATLPVDLPSLLEKAQQVYLRHGIATVQDGASSFDDFSKLKKLAEQKKIVLDVHVYPMADTACVEAFEKNREYTKNYKDHLKLSGVKVVLDGSPQGKTAWMSEPYTDGSNGISWMSDEQLGEMARMAVDNGLQMLAHCNGDAASQQYLDQYEAAFWQSKNPNKEKLRPVMIHCQTVRYDQLKRFPDLHMIPSIFVEHVHRWGDIHLKNMGAERADHISPAGWAKEWKLPFTFHQDTPILAPDMLRTVQTAVERRTQAGVTLGEAQKISVFDALQAVTSHAAYQYGEEAEKGTLEVGKRADFVILDKNPLETELSEIEKIRVLATIKDDRALYQINKQEA